MKYMAFSGKQIKIVQHVSKKSVHIFVEKVYEIYSKGGSGTCILYSEWSVATG
jgi:hypothetical protein